MVIFEPLDTPHHWRPSALAAGPFAGLQGGAVASLLTAEVEALAGARNWGTAISAAACFLRPTPMAELRTELAVVTEGGRVSVVDNTLWPVGDAQPCATVRITMSRERAVEVPGFRGYAADSVDPSAFPQHRPHAIQGRSWFMDAMEARAGGDAAWFRMLHSVIPSAGPLAQVLGPADWTHGIGRPVQDVVADPNPNLAVQLFRPPRGEWVGIRAETRWRPESGLGVGSGVLLDRHGEIGRVSMSVILVPFSPARIGSAAS
ncbi:thioesterase family protein [Bradyrhizobium jicamae]|uniref:Thioesterase family protein n=1 Tax=Bradyrhizobium jicamae TaxID=280332 RepID=A0ABS5FPH1_9BRAD|nr:acyl-CoA thioesterase domain-containing protein [Bradyrhizobium jicamae]MBR0798656.1 thioesterase family protein [Bradyrhizobium jicamae]